MTDVRCCPLPEVAGKTRGTSLCAQRDGERRPQDAALARFQVEFAAVQAGAALDDCQAKAGTAVTAAREQRRQEWQTLSPDEREAIKQRFREQRQKSARKSASRTGSNCATAGRT